MSEPQWIGGVPQPAQPTPLSAKGRGVVEVISPGPKPKRTEEPVPIVGRGVAAGMYSGAVAPPIMGSDGHRRGEPVREVEESEVISIPRKQRQPLEERPHIQRFLAEQPTPVTPTDANAIAALRRDLDKLSTIVARLAQIVERLAPGSGAS